MRTMQATREQIAQWAKEGRVEVTMEPTREQGGVAEVRFTRSGRTMWVEVQD